MCFTYDWGSEPAKGLSVSDDFCGDVCLSELQSGEFNRSADNLRCWLLGGWELPSVIYFEASDYKYWRFLIFLSYPSCFKASSLILVLRICPLVLLFQKAASREEERKMGSCLSKRFGSCESLRFLLKLPFEHPRVISVFSDYPHKAFLSSPVWSKREMTGTHNLLPECNFFSAATSNPT